MKPHPLTLIFSRASATVILFSQLAGVPSISVAQIIGSTSPSATAAEDQSDKVSRLLAKLSERLTTQELNVKKITCLETVRIDRRPVPGGKAGDVERRFVMSGEMKQRGSFSTDSTFVETHTPAAASSPDSAAGPDDAALLVRDSFSTASEFFGLRNQENYAQNLVGPQKLGDRDTFVVGFQTVKQLESRKIDIAGKLVAMRIAGQGWIDAKTGALLRMEIRQVKLPKGVREFSYDIRYGPDSNYILPSSVTFRRSLRNETISTVQEFSNCKVN